MRMSVWGTVCGVLLAGYCVAADAAELSECVTLAVKPNGDASLTNSCGNVLNVTYCVDNARSARACSSAQLGVATLSAGGSDLIPAYVDTGSGAVYWAVCAYPEAAVDWKPGPAAAYVCRKTCVMC